LIDDFKNIYNITPITDRTLHYLQITLFVKNVEFGSVSRKEKIATNRKIKVN